VNLRDDNKKTPADVWREARDERLSKYNKYKESGKEVEEHNNILARTFNEFLKDKLKDTGAALNIEVYDNKTVAHIRTTLSTPVTTVVNLSFRWPCNILTEPRGIVHDFSTDILGAIKRYHKDYPGVVQKLDKCSCSTIIKTKTKFFKQ